jgi:hypothetical protein
MFILVLPLSIIIVVIPVVWNGIDYYNSGKHCINAIAQVGDRVQTKDSVMLVEKIEGPSILCKDPELPIKAVLKEEK